MKSGTQLPHSQRFDAVTAAVLTDTELQTLRILLSFHVDEVSDRDGCPFDGEAFVNLCETFGVEVPRHVTEMWTLT